MECVSFLWNMEYVWIYCELFKNVGSAVYAQSYYSETAKNYNEDFIVANKDYFCFYAP